ncbi:hypothetical protein BpHYR1_049913 [Brachionus plicatilis]|uniref:Uncharacterized protein n=1 Tax=Brachionus plicatilis TaxID=10195 RepID=A0A3M7SJB4_BRAPC|nr:hypothetical protein BpHYR1_049913 [Brachionus plicatilis]
MCVAVDVIAERSDPTDPCALAQFRLPCFWLNSHNFFVNVLRAAQESHFHVFFCLSQLLFVNDLLFVLVFRCLYDFDPLLRRY